MSPELETLDQLLSGDLSLAIVRKLYSDDDALVRGVLGLLNRGDVRILSSDNREIPEWQWRELFETNTAMERIGELSLCITEQGARKIA